MTPEQRNSLATHVWLLQTVRALVDETDLSKIQITPESREFGTRFLVQVPKAEIGKVIGKEGRNARAIRRLLYARGQKDGQRYEMDVQNFPTDQPAALAAA